MTNPTPSEDHPEDILPEAIELLVNYLEDLKSYPDAVEDGVEIKRVEEAISWMQILDEDLNH